MPLNSRPAHHGDGLCLLSLDAGGTPGVTQLNILAELMRRRNYDVRDEQMDLPCTIFDMIGGTGSGGFIAIILVIFGLTAEQALEDFIELSTVVLEAPGIDAESRTEALRAYINKLMGKYSIPTDMRLMGQNDRSKGCKLIVPISYKHNVGMRGALRNYIVRHEQAPNTTVFDALLGTLATPPLFNSATILSETDSLEIMGADMTLSNPAGEMIADAYAAFGADAQLACLLSLGCGRAPPIVAPSGHDLVTWNRFFQRLTTDSERQARALDSQMGRLGLYHRFSVDQVLVGEDGTLGAASGAALAHAGVYLAEPSTSRSLELCIDSLKNRDGIASLEHLKHTGGERIRPPALPPLTSTFVMRKEPWDFIERVILGVGASEKDKYDGPRMLAVTGLGGCGKTQIALKFMRVHESKFASQFFIDGSSKSRIRADTLRHVRSLGVEHSQKDFDACLHFLRKPSPDGPRLILYDNVDDPHLKLGPLLPQGDGCAIIITSRNWSISQLCPGTHLELDVMSIDEAVNLLLQTPALSESVDGREDATLIAQALGYLPIALTQARSYMHQTKCSGRVYLQRLQTSKDKLLARPMKNQPDMRYNSTYAAFGASFALLVPSTQRLLWLLSYFHWSKFPLEIITVAAKHKFSGRQTTYTEEGDGFGAGKAVLESIFLQDGKWDTTDLDEMIISLQNYSLITLVRGVDTALVQMHPLAHEWVHSCIPEEDRARYQSAAILLLALGARDEHTPSAQYLASHVVHMSPLWDQLHLNDAGAFGYILHEGGLFEGASQLLETVVAGLRREGSSRINLTNALTSLALAYCASGRVKQAESLQLEVQHIRKEVLGDRHPLTIKATNYLATTYRDLGDLKKTEELQMEVLKLTNDELGSTHVDTLWASGNLANTHRLLGRLVEAEKLQIEVHNLRKERLGERHPDTIKALSNLSLTYRAMKKMKEAVELQEEVLRFRKEVLGETHPNTLDSMENLGTTYAKLGRPAEALELFNEALRLRKDLLGERHPATLSAANNLAYTLRDFRRLEEAEKMQVETISLMKLELGEEHFETTNAMLTLAEIYESGRQLTKALDLLSETATLIARNQETRQAQFLECKEIEVRVRKLAEPRIPAVLLFSLGLAFFYMYITWYQYH